MKYWTLFFTLIAFSTAFSQISYDFAKPLPPNGKEVKNVDPRHFGEYKSTKSDRIIVINEKGIFAKNNFVTYISRETIRESSKYQKRGNYLFGVTEKDSVECFEEGDRYYFAVSMQEEMFVPDKGNQLNAISTSTYVLNFFENGAYVPCLISFVNGDFQIQYFDYADDTPVFQEFTLQSAKKQGNLTIKTLAPTKEQFAQISFSQMFGEETMYQKIRMY